MPPIDMGAERRQHPRIASDLSVALHLDDGKHDARVRDLSESGMCFFLDRPIPEMTILEISFDLQANDRTARVSTTGVVVRSRKISPAVDHFEIALFFNGLDTDSRAAMKAFIEQELDD